MNDPRSFVDSDVNNPVTSSENEERNPFGSPALWFFKTPIFLKACILNKGLVLAINVFRASSLQPCRKRDFLSYCKQILGAIERELKWSEPANTKENDQLLPSNPRQRLPVAVWTGRVRPDASERGQQVHQGRSLWQILIVTRNTLWERQNWIKRLSLLMWLDETKIGLPICRSISMRLCLASKVSVGTATSVSYTL